LKFEGLKSLEICAKRTIATEAKCCKTAKNKQTKKKRRDRRKNMESHKTVIFLNEKKYPYISS